MKAIILAAGRGERLRPLTDNTPKPLIVVKNKMLIEYHIEALAKAGIQDIVINISYLSEKIKNAIGNGSRYGVNIHYSFEPAALETGGGIFQALPLLGDKAFIAVSADIFCDYDFNKLPLSSPKGLAHLVLTDNPAFHPHGDFALNEGFIHAQGNNKLNFAGISVLSPELFKNAAPGKFPLAPLIKRAAAENLVTGEYFDGIWFNIGCHETYRQVLISV